MKTNLLRAIVSLTALALTLPACSASAPTPASPQTPFPSATPSPGLQPAGLPPVYTPAYLNPGHITLDAGGMARFTPQPISGTPEPDPKLTLHVVLVDATTGQPVLGDVRVGYAEAGGNLVYRGVSRFTLELPGQTDDVIYITIQAEGYETWSQGYRYRLEHSRTWNLLIRMTPTCAPITPALGPVG